MFHRLVLAPAALLGLAGCANFQAVSEFARQTGQVSAVVRQEFKDLDALCREQAELTIVVNDIADDGPLQSCRAYKAGQGRLAAVTVDLLDAYAQALQALADDRRYEPGAELGRLGERVGSLQDRQGQPLISAGEASALANVVHMLSDIATLSRREAAVRRLLQEREALAATAGILRSYFVREPGAPAGRARAPYVHQAALIADAYAGTEARLRSAVFQSAEPIRTIELLRAGRERQGELARRTSGEATGVPATIAAALDAWRAALDRFDGEALTPQPREFLARLKHLRNEVRAARSAIAAEQN